MKISYGTMVSLAALVCFAAGGLSPAQAVVLSNDGYSVGIGTNGELFDNGAGIGFLRKSDGYDSILPGTPRDSWGVSSGTSAAYADQNYYGSNNIVSTTSSSTASMATFTTLTNFGLNVSQVYSFAATNVLRISETISNISGITASAVLFQRNVDFDMAGNAFRENSFAGPISGRVVGASNFGFEAPSPLSPFAMSCNAGCNATGDLGAGIRVSLGDIGAGKSVSFDYFYALSASGQQADGLMGQVAALGGSYLVTSQSTESGAYPSLGANVAVLGFGSPSTVPLPASAPMFGAALLGLAGFGYARSRSARTKATGLSG